MTKSESHGLGAIILTGGASRRMGIDKASLVWGDQRAVDLVAALAQTVGVIQIVTSGDGDFGRPRAPDPAPFSGPVAGLISASALFDARITRILALAVDAPTIRPVDLAPLLSAAAPGAAFIGLPLPMVFDVAATPSDALGGWPLRRFVERAGLVQLNPPPEAVDRLRGANTPEERARLARDAAQPDPPKA